MFNIQRHNPDTGMWTGLFLWDGNKQEEVARATFDAIKKISTERLRLVKQTYSLEIIEEAMGAEKSID